MGGDQQKFPALRVACVTGALALAPITASQARPALDDRPDAMDDAAGFDAQTQSDRGAEAGDFTLSFAPFEGPVHPVTRPADAVNLSTFSAPREAPPPPVENRRISRNLGTGVASYYGKRFHGRLTANGERFNMRAMTAAHRTLPFGTLVRVTNPRNGRSVTVRINDRGPFIRGRSIDLSRAAAERIGMISRGHARVEMAVVAR